MPAGHVDVDLRSVRRAWRESGQQRFWVELRTTSTAEDAFSEAVNDNYEWAGPEGAYVEANMPVPSGFIFQASDIEDDAQLVAWLDAFGRILARRGFDGVLRGVTSVGWPSWYGTDSRSAPAAFVAWTFDLRAMTEDPYRTMHWHVLADATHRICQHLVAWTAPGGPEAVVHQWNFGVVVTDHTKIEPVLAPAVAAGVGTSLLRQVEAEERGRVAYTMAGGETVLQVLGDHDPWSERIDTLRQGITALASLVDQALIRPATTFPINWTTIGIIQELDGLEEHHIRANKHLLTRYVPDAHGIQVLREDHLANARDLSSWSITDLGDGRHLVEARDLAPWYSTPLPDPDVVTRARQDFGSMILTKETIAANPPPWGR